VLGHGAQQHPRVGFAVRVVGVAPLGRDGFRMEGAAVDGVDAGADLRQLRGHGGMKSVHVLKAIETSGDPRLIGDHEHPPTRLIGAPNRFARAGRPAEVLHAVRIADVDVQHAVAVEEQGRAAHAGPALRRARSAKRAGSTAAARSRGRGEGRAHR
jgi:hypothetical protein